MSAPDQGPLSALLASHPEECAAVVAVLCAEGYDGSTAQGCVDDMRIYRSTPLDLAMVERVLAALAGAGLAERYSKTEWRLAGSTWRYAIARMGAAAWLAARLSVKPTTLERMSAAFDHLAAINVVADRLPELERDAVEQARLRLFVALDGTAHAKRGIPEYGEDEVRERTGAGAPAKGERRAAE